MIIDAHCHLYYDDLANDIENVLHRANEAGVSRLVCVGTNIEDSKKCLSITENNDDIFASSGVHPHDAKDATEGYTDEIYELMEYESMIAIGEIGYRHGICWIFSIGRVVLNKRRVYNSRLEGFSRGR